MLLPPFLCLLYLVILATVCATQSSESSLPLSSASSSASISSASASVAPSPSSSAIPSTSTSLPGSTFSPNVTATGPWTHSILRAQKFVANLTLEEKINITTGVGTLGRCVGNTGTISRLNFSGFCLQDSPLGVRNADYVSAFPAGMNAAMTFDTELMFQRGRAIGSEHRGKGVNIALGPMMNLARTPQGGRNWEGFGADPFLSGVASSFTIQGIQSTGVIACAKHFIANEQEQFRGGGGGKEDAQSYSSDIDERTMREVYLWPFMESVRSGVGSVMCAYNRVNGQWACESDLIGKVLKDELDFKGPVISDWTALVSGVSPAVAGVDMNMPGFISYILPSEPNPSNTTGSFWGSALIEAVNNGSVPQWRVDDMVVRSMAAFYELGQDKEGYPEVNFNYQSKDTFIPGLPGVQNHHINVQYNHSLLIRSIGAASVVLLKQSPDSPLPLNKTGHGLPKNIAILGSDAGPNLDGPNGCKDRGCGQGTLAMGWGSGTAEFPYLIDPLTALASYIRQSSPKTTIQYLLNDDNLFQAGVYAKEAEVTMVFVNADSGEGYIAVDENAGDRKNLTLWHGGEELIQAAASNCNNTIVVIHSVGPVIVEEWIDHPNITAVLFAGLPGQESGNGLVDVLSGEVTPSGRVISTWAKNLTDYPAQLVSSALPGQEVVVPIPYSEGLEIDYRHFDANKIEPRFEFGYGLSYSKFKYEGLSITKLGEFKVENGKRHNPVGGNPFLYTPIRRIHFTLHNVGNFTGHEVSQLYLGFPPTSGEPPKVLRGFDRKLIKKGGKEKVELDLRRLDVAFWDESKEAWVIPKGTFEVFVGASSRDIRLKGKFENEEDVVIPPSAKGGVPQNLERKLDTWTCGSTQCISMTI